MREKNKIKKFKYQTKGKEKRSKKRKKYKKKARLKEKSLWREKRVIEGKDELLIHLKYLEYWQQCLTETAELFLTMKFHFLSHYFHHFVFLKCNLNSLLHVIKGKWQKIWNFGTMKIMSSSDVAFDIKVLKVSPSLKYNILSKLKKQVFYLAR